MLPASLRRAIFFFLGVAGGVALVAIGTVAYLSLVNTVEESSAVAKSVDQQKLDDKATENLPKIPARKELAVTDLNLKQLPSQSYFTRVTAFHSYLRGRSVEFVVDFLEESATIGSSSLRKEARNAGIHRLAQLDPLRAIGEVQEMTDPAKSSLMTVVFDEWSADDLEAAKEHALGLRQQDQRSALEGILRSRSELSDRDRLVLARHLGHEEMVDDERTLTIAGEPIENPETAWNEFLDEHGGDLTDQSHAQLALLRHILDSWVESGESKSVTSAVKSAIRKGRGNDSAVRLLLESWARVDPSVSFDAVSGIEDDETRKRMQQAIVTAWVELAPLASLDAFELIPNEIRDWSKKHALVVLSETLPAQAAERLEIIPTDDQAEVAGTIAVNWARLDPESAHDWVRSTPEIQDFRQVLMYRVVLEVSQLDPELAFKWALDEPTIEQWQGRGFEQNVVWNVALQGKYETALSMAARARDIENQQWSYVQIGNALVRRGKSDQAWSLLEEIPERFHAIYLGQVTTNWVVSEPDMALESLERMPTEEIQKDVAVALLQHGRFMGIFSKEQLRSLKKYLPEFWQQQIE